MAMLAYDNAILGATITGTGFSASPPVGNLGTSQVPSPHAEFTGATASFEVTFAASTSVRVLALLAHDLPNGATITWSKPDDTQLAQVTWSRFRNRPPNSYVVLSAAETLYGVKCAISNAGTGTHRIAAAFASPVWEFAIAEGVAVDNTDSGTVTRIGGTDWPFADARRREIPVQSGPILDTDMFGISGGVGVQSILDTAGQTRPVILLKKTNTADWIASTAVYGLMTRQRVEHINGRWHRAAFGVLESR